MKVNECPFQPGARPLVEGKPGAGQLGAPLKIEDPQMPRRFPSAVSG